MDGQKLQGLREVRRVIEWRDGCVYKTATEGYAWVDAGLSGDGKDIFYCSLSTQLHGKVSRTMRMVSPDTPTVVQTEVL